MPKYKPRNIMHMVIDISSQVAAQAYALAAATEQTAAATRKQNERDLLGQMAEEISAAASDSNASA